MKTNSVSLISFESKTPKPRYINENMRASLESLLWRMNSATKVEKRGDYLVSTIINKLKSVEGYVFEDERRLSKPVLYSEQMKGFSVLKFGRTRLDIDNENGEIIDYKKPFYKPWFMVLKKAEEVLYSFRSYYNQQEVIKRETMQLNNLTPEGVRNIKKLVLRVEKQRLENVTKQLEKEVENEGK